MENQEQSLHIQLNEEILQFLLDYQKKHTEFTFATRVSNRRNRLSERLWFQGQGNYIFVGFYKIGDSRNKTKTIGFVITLKNNNVDKNYIEIVYPIDEEKYLIKIHKEIKESIEGLSYFETKEPERDRKYYLYFKSNNWKENLSIFLGEVKPIIDSKIKAFKLESEFFFTGEKFKKNLEKIEEIKKGDIEMAKNVVIQENEEKLSIQIYPLNQILYGPPGTGKTYKTVDLAYRITQEIEEEEEISYDQARRWFNSELNKEDDRQLDFITFHQNYSYEDFVMGIKPDIEGEGLGFREHKGIFFEICQRALKNLQDSQKPIETIEQEKNTEELFEAFKNNLIDEIEKEQTGKYQLTNAAYISAVSNDAFIYTGDNWNQDGRMKFEDILKIYNNQNANSRKEAKLTPNISRTAIEHITYYFKIASEFRDFAQKQTINSTKTEKIKLKNYVLIIDEINRANISRVFGELITLIEEDKRWGNDYPMEVRLPDGRTKFTVPKNLYIIGTMNTADKSIALLDIALRRRFEFTALYPNSSLIADGFKLFFETLNNKIKDKKGIDFMVGHAYFMVKKGTEFDFIKTMNTKVIPLLNEYFYNTKSNQEVKDLIDKSLTNSTLPYQIQEDVYQLKITNK